MAKYINTETLEYPVTERQIRALFQHTSFPAAFVPPEPFAIVVESPIPSIAWDQNLVEAQPELVDGEWSQVWIVADASNEEKAERLQAAKDAKHAEVQAEKSSVRDGGFMVNGVLFDSDAGARVAYLELAMRVQADPSFSTTWKASDGVWVTMDAQLFSQVYAAGAAHIGSVFAWQAAKDAEIDASTTIEQISAIDVTFAQ